MNSLSLRRAVPGSLMAALGAFAVTSVSLALVPGPQKTYTLDADFDQGLLFNVNHTAPNGNQLQLNQQIGTFPLLWVANAGEDTVSKIDTNTGKEIGRYRTWFNVGTHGPWDGPAPSRTAVDADGNCYVANRQFAYRPAEVIKILSSGFIDRNSDGIMQTSTDTNNNGVIDPGEILPITDLNGNGIVEPNEIADERIAWVSRVGGDYGLGRSLAIAPDGTIWVGLYYSYAYYQLNPSTGAIMGVPISVYPNTPYGAVVDASGILWSASLSSNIGKLDTVNKTYLATYYPGYNYGISYGAGSVYLGGSNPVRKFNTATNATSEINLGFGTYAVSVAPNGDILVHGSSVQGFGQGATRFKPDGTVVWSKANQPGVWDGQGRGCVPDSNDDVWTINLDNNNVQKYKGTDGTALGVFPVGLSPYTYSDATGSTFVQTIGLGKWTVVLDTAATTTTNALISWTANVPNGASLVVKSAASNTKSTPGAYTPADFTAVTNGGTAGVTGRYQAVEVTFTAAPTNNASPVLLDLKIKAPDVCPPLDINKDGWIDSADQALILAGVRTRSKDLYLDVNCDGKVDIADSRYIALRFTR
jgi:hypothetical protein